MYTHTHTDTMEVTSEEICFCKVCKTDIKSTKKDNNFRKHFAKCGTTVQKSKTAPANNTEKDLLAAASTL